MRKLLIVLAVGVAWVGLVVLPPIAPVYAQDTTTLLANFLNALRSGTPTVPVGGSLTTAGVSASLTTNTTAASNVSTSETDLITYSLPANTLSSNGQKVRISVWGSTAANANTKTARVYFGSTQVTGGASTTASGAAWFMQATVIRTGSATQIGSLWGHYAGSMLGGVNSTPSADLTAAVTIKVTGQSGTASADITALAMMVEWIP